MRDKRSQPVQEISISEFKAKCLALLDKVSKTKTPLRVTRRGKAIADVVPISAQAAGRTWLGSLSGTMEITGNIVTPVIDADSIEALKD
jgi:prevent-host-death family protein